MRNEYRIDGDSVYIRFRKKHSHLETIISLQDLRRLLECDCSVYAKVCKRDTYAVVYLVDKKKELRLHRYIMDAPKEMVVDHINHNTLDNRRTNLRVVTQVENTQNMGRVRSDNKSGFRGVYFRKRERKWLAYAYLKGKRQYLGLYETAEEANQVVTNFRALYQEASPDHRNIETPSLPEFRHTVGMPNRTSGIKGISWNKKSQKWGIYIYSKGKLHFGGYHVIIEDAIDALTEFKVKMGIQ